MNVTDQFLEIGVFLTNNGLVSVLKQMSVASMTSVKPCRITGQQPPHQSGQTRSTTSEQDMGMIDQQCPVL